MLKKFFSKKRKNKKVVLKKNEHAHHDWAIGIFIFIFVSIVMIGISGFIFFEINSSKEVVVEETSQTDILNQELLEKTLRYYDAKEERYAKYQRQVPIAPEL